MTLDWIAISAFCLGVAIATVYFFINHRAFALKEADLNELSAQSNREVQELFYETREHELAVHVKSQREAFEHLEKNEPELAMQVLQKALAKIYAQQSHLLIEPGFCTEMRDELQTLVDASERSVRYEQIVTGELVTITGRYPDRPSATYKTGRHFLDPSLSQSPLQTG